ncbi:MAG: phage scaffolding protein [Anaerolineae bacterium]|nr:phage scaffolding protein [Anaerolineae bacterium]MCB0246641.1 phage scaffolding protein [Anaerolineae bacterium]
MATMTIDENTTDTTQTDSGANGHSQDRATFTQTDIDRIVADRLTRERQKFADYDDLKSKAAKLTDLEKAQMSEAEKQAARVAELEAQIAQAQADAQAQMKAANRRLIQSALVAEATAARFHKPEDAYRFVDMDALKVDDAGNVSGAKDAIKTLAKERGYLVNTGTAPDINAGSVSATKQAEQEALLDDVKKRFRL